MVRDAYYLSEPERERAAVLLSSHLDLKNDSNSRDWMRKVLEEYFPGCEPLYVSLKLGEVTDAEIDDTKIPRLIVDMVGVELFEGKHGRIIREMLLRKLFEKDYWGLREFEDADIPQWSRTNAEEILEGLVRKKWIPGSIFARTFVSKFGFSSKFYGTRSMGKPRGVETVEKRMRLAALKPFQLNLKNQIMDILGKDSATENRCILTLPTGAGKTRIAAEALIEYWKTRPDGIRWIVWIAQTEELCEQALECFRQIWEDFGEAGTPLNIFRVWGGRPIPDPDTEGIIVAGIAQLYSASGSGADAKENELERIKADTGVVVVDEAHHSFAPSYPKVLRSMGISRRPKNTKQAPLIGLTATPFRTSDAETAGLSKSYGDRILWPRQEFEPKNGFDDRWRDRDFITSTLTSKGILSRPSFRYIDTESTFKMNAKETEFLGRMKILPESLLRKVGTDTKRNMEVFEILKAQAKEGKTILFFGANLNQATMMSKFLNDINIKSAVITAGTRYAARQGYVRLFREGVIKVLCNYQVLTTGFDAPKVDTIVIARPTGSRILYEQMVGRGLRGREFGGTDECRIITILDNILNYETERVKLGYEDYATTETRIDEMERAKIEQAKERFFNPSFTHVQTDAIGE